MIISLFERLNRAVLRPRSLAQRERLFQNAEAPSTIVLPSREIFGRRLAALLRSPHADFKDEGSAARRLIRYFHYPVDIHQENLDDGPLHQKLARVTVRTLAVPVARIEELAATHAAGIDLGTGPPGRQWAVVRLRDRLMPVLARVYYALLFEEECPEPIVDLLVKNARLLTRVIKGLARRDTRLGTAVFEMLYARVQRTSVERRFAGCDVSREQQAKHLQGVFFHTGIVQLSECVAHTLIEVARHPGLTERLRADPVDTQLLGHVVSESLRMFPLFGTTNRVARQEIKLDDEVTVPRGTHLFIDFERCHRDGFDRPHEFFPERWEGRSTDNGVYIPFGAGSRKCPAERFSRTLTAGLVMAIVRRFDVHAPAPHFRSLDDGGLVLVTPRGAVIPAPMLYALIRYTRARAALEQAAASLTKMVVFPRTVEDARREGRARSP